MIILRTDNYQTSDFRSIQRKTMIARLSIIYPHYLCVYAKAVQPNISTPLMYPRNGLIQRMKLGDVPCRTGNKAITVV